MKDNTICVDGYYEEISAIANNVVNDIENVLIENVENKTLKFKKKLVDGANDVIERIYYDAESEEVLIDTDACKASYLREEPVNILLDIAEYINFAVFNVHS